MGSDGVERGRLLIVEDCNMQRAAYERGLEAHFQEIVSAASMCDAIEAACAHRFDAALLDLELPDGSSLDIIPILVDRHPGITIVVVTGFGSYAAAVDAVRLGASDFLAKPASFPQILAALDGRDVRGLRGGGHSSSRPIPLSLARVEWEYINRVLAESSGNVSEAARRLGIRRQSLQRKLRNRPHPHPIAYGADEDSGRSLDRRRSR
jgi:two-component system, response regulator RegA